MNNTISPPQQYISQRLAALDLARFLAMVMMIQGHTIYALGSPDLVNIEVFPWNVWHFLRGFTAPVFLTVSGAVHVFANKRQEDGTLRNRVVSRRIRIALLLIIIGYVLAFPASTIYDAFFVPPERWAVFFRVNILHLIGITLLFLLIFFLVTRTDKSLRILSLIAGILVIFFTPFAKTVDWFSILPEGIAAYFSEEHGSLFPIFPNSAYVFLGTTFGTLLKKIPTENRTDFLLKWGIPIGAVFLIIGYGFAPYQYLFSFEHYDLQAANFAIIFKRIGFVFVGLSVVSAIYKMTKGLSAYYTIFGRRALFIYIGHLILIYGTPIFPSLHKLYAKSLDLGQVLLCVIGVELLTIAMAYSYDTCVRKYPNSIRLFRIIIAAYLIYVLFF